jgi:hypothetical protein
MRKVVACLNDLHGGSPFAVSPSRWLLPEGNEFHPNELQRVINDHYYQCWRNVAELRRKAQLIVLVVGDVVEGMHHQTTQVITGRIDEQEAMAAAVIEAGLETGGFRWHGKQADSIRFFSGTDAHDGLDGSSIERVARNVLDIDRQDSRRAARGVGRLRVNGVRFDVAHKPGSGPGSRAQTTGNAFAAWLKSLYLAGLERGDWPRYVLTAHHHQYLRRTVQSITASETVVTGYILPAWKVHDHHVNEVAPFALASVGMVVFDVTDSGAVGEYDWRIPVEQNEVEEL